MMKRAEEDDNLSDFEEEKAAARANPDEDSEGESGKTLSKKTN